jgi:putative glutathione S-transferase
MSTWGDARLKTLTLPPNTLRQAEAGRYVVYVGNACPWCHRVLLALALRGLGGAVRIVRLAADPERASRGGWVLADADPVFGAADLRQVYDGLSPGFRGRCTAPLLVDSVAKRAVCNESSLILSSLAALRLPGCTAVDLRPAALAGRIDDWNDRRAPCAALHCVPL